MPYFFIASLAASNQVSDTKPQRTSLFKDPSLQQGLLGTFSNGQTQDNINDLSDALELIERERLKITIDLEKNQFRLHEIKNIEKIGCDTSDAYKEPGLSLYWCMNKAKLLQEKDVVSKKIDTLQQLLASLDVRKNQTESSLKAEYVKLEESNGKLKSRVESYKNNSCLDGFFSSRAEKTIGDDDREYNSLSKLQRALG